MVNMEVGISTILIVLSNVIGFLVWLQVNDFKQFLKETRKKIDDHEADKEVHCDAYKAQVLHSRA